MILRENTQRLFYSLVVGLIGFNLPMYLFLVRPEKEAASLDAQRIQQAQADLRNKQSTINTLKGIEEKLAESR